MAKESSIYLEKITVLPEDKAMVNQDVINRFNFEGNQPLTEGLTYIFLPQKNFAAEFTRDGQTLPPSQRFWAVGLNEDNEAVEIRSIGASTMSAMGLGWVATDPKPTVSTRQKEDGSLGLQSGLSWVYAMGRPSASHFITGENSRLVIKKPAAIEFTGNKEAYTVDFVDRQIHVGEDGNVVIVTRSLKTFERLDEPTDDQVKAAEAALKAQKVKLS